MFVISRHISDPPGDFMQQFCFSEFHPLYPNQDLIITEIGQFQLLPLIGA